MNARLHTHLEATPASAPAITQLRRPSLQKKCSCASHPAGEMCAECQRNQASFLSRSQPTGRGLGSSLLQKVLSSPGQELDTATRALMEPRFGFNFSRVRVHADSTAAESALAVNALAYTVGRDIAFAAGRYAPDTPAGRRLLAHELTHVVQQGGVAADLHHLQPAPSPEHLEREAEHFASLNTELRVTPGGIMRAGPSARPSSTPLSLQRSASFTNGSVSEVFNLAERYVKGERDAGNTDFVLNGTTFAAGKNADTLHKALHAPEVESIPGKTPSYVECRFKSVPDNIGSYEMKLPKPGKWSYETTKAKMAALFPKLTACARAQGSTNFVINENETVRGNVRTHENHHVTDDRATFQDIVVDWDNRIKGHLGPTGAKKDDKPATTQKQENKPSTPPLKKENKTVEAPRKGEKTTETPKKEDKPPEPPKKEPEKAPAQVTGTKAAGKDKNSCQDVLYRIIAGSTGLSMNPNDVVDRIVTSINQKASAFHATSAGRMVEIFNLDPGDDCHAVRGEIR